MEAPVAIRFLVDWQIWEAGDATTVNRILAGQLVERGIATYI
jgi:chaperonin GroEL (HSP60 family)